MMEMQTALKFVDLCRAGDVKTIQQFSDAQKEQRTKIEKAIKQQSNRSRENIKECISKVLDTLRHRILNEITLDEVRSKHNPIQSSNTATMKRKEGNNRFEKLGFPQTMTYGHRSSLRNECSRFLRFAYLVDFISLESLANIYRNSIEEMIARLQYLDSYAEEKLPEIMKMDFDDSNGNGQAQRGYEPLFYLNVQLNDSKPIPAEEISLVPIDEFILPPRGQSKEEDFDLLCHLEVEAVKPEGDEEAEEEEEEANDAPPPQLYRRALPNAHKFWIRLEPDAEEFNQQIMMDF